MNGRYIALRGHLNDVIGLVVIDPVRPRFRGAGPHERRQDEQSGEQGPDRAGQP